MINEIFNQRDNSKIPIWFLRQAGRHLPEYLKIRDNYKNFIDFCLCKDGIYETTLLPTKVYDIDSDTLFRHFINTAFVRPKCYFCKRRWSTIV